MTPTKLDQIQTAKLPGVADRRKALVLGAGYVGMRIAAMLEDADWAVDATHRLRPVEFRMESPRTWKNLDRYEQTFITLPLGQDAMASHFEKWVELVYPRLGHVVVISTTSLIAANARQITNNHAIYFETELSARLKQRHTAESTLRALGAQIVYASGLCGPGRHPGQWLKRQRISTLNKWVNLIHVDDLACIAIAADQFEIRGESFIATSAAPYAWGDILKTWLKRYPNSLDGEYVAGLQKTIGTDANLIGKQLDGSETLARLGLILNHPDLVHWLAHSDTEL